jgi:hypothetical protein
LCGWLVAQLCPCQKGLDVVWLWGGWLVGRVVIGCCMVLGRLVGGLVWGEAAVASPVYTSLQGGQHQPHVLSMTPRLGISQRGKRILKHTRNHRDNVRILKRTRNHRDNVRILKRTRNHRDNVRILKHTRNHRDNVRILKHTRNHSDKLYVNHSETHA